MSAGTSVHSLRDFFIAAACLLIASAALLSACSASSPEAPEPFKVSKSVETECLGGLFEMDIPVGMSSNGVSKHGRDSSSEAFFPDKGGTDSGIYISSLDVSSLDANKFVSEYFDSPPSNATYKYRNIKIKDLSPNHYLASADIFEDGAEESRERKICFALDSHTIINISIKNIQKTYTNTAESSIRVL